MAGLHRKWLPRDSRRRPRATLASSRPRYDSNEIAGALESVCISNTLTRENAKNMLNDVATRPSGEKACREGFENVPILGRYWSVAYAGEMW